MREKTGVRPDRTMKEPNKKHRDRQKIKSYRRGQQHLQYESKPQRVPGLQSSESLSKSEMSSE